MTARTTEADARGMGPASSRGQLAFLAALLAYDLVMFWHVHTYQWGLERIASSYAPVHPVLPRLGQPEPILPMAHATWLLVAHGMGSAFPLVAVLAQIASPIRRRSRWLHRWNGRAILLVTVAFAALPGLWMSAGILHASVGLRAMVAGLAVIVLIATAQTWRSIRAGNLAAHVRWALRLTAYLHVIPVVARLYFWAVWVAATGTADATARPAALAQTFEIIGWITVLSVLPLGEAAVRLLTPRGR